MTNLVLLHAFPVNRHLWDAQTEYLTKAGRRVLAPDLAGFGDSRVPQESTMAALAEQVLTQVGQPAVFAGLSMGGYVLMEILRQHPEMVTGAIFMDTKAGADTEQARAATRGGRRGAGCGPDPRTGRRDDPQTAR